MPNENPNQNDEWAGIGNTYIDSAFHSGGGVEKNYTLPYTYKNKEGEIIEGKWSGTATDVRDAKKKAKKAIKSMLELGESDLIVTYPKHI